LSYEISADFSTGVKKMSRGKTAKKQRRMKNNGKTFQDLDSGFIR
jgi:hypothetical protein